MLPLLFSQTGMSILFFNYFSVFATILHLVFMQEGHQRQNLLSAIFITHIILLPSLTVQNHGLDGNASSEQTTPSVLEKDNFVA